MKKVLLFAYEQKDGTFTGLHKPEKRKGKRSNFFMGDNNSFSELATKYNLSKMDYKLLIYLLANMDWDNNVIASTTYLADVFETQTSFISRSIKSLSEQGIIMKGKIKGQTVFHIEEHIATKGQKEVEE